MKPREGKTRSAPQVAYLYSIMVLTVISGLLAAFAGTDAKWSAAIPGGMAFLMFLMLPLALDVID